MTATVKEFCRINGINEKSADIADLIYAALTGGDYDGNINGDSHAGEKV